jgi:hypothetical protein
MRLRNGKVNKFVTAFNVTTASNPKVELPYTPNNCRQALAKDNPWREEWLNAIIEEMDEMLNRKVFEQIDLSDVKNAHIKPFQSRFAFRVKKEGDTITKFKARLVVKGFSQKYGVDYDETYAPTISFGSILTVLHIAATKRWIITGCDIGNAYLEALTNRELYMYLPYDWTGYDEDGKPNRIVVRLLRNLYGSKQAALMWYNHLYDILIEYGFERLIHEPCCFQIRDKNKRIIVCVYVDDLLMAGPYQEVIDAFKEYLRKKFDKIKDLGDLERYLGLQLTRLSNGRLALSQTDYINDIIKQFKVDEMSIKPTPLPVNLDDYNNLQGDGSVPPLLELVGKLRYLADRTRPDIAFATSYLAGFAAKPAPQHWKLALRVVQYLKGTIDKQLIIGSPSGTIELFAAADASFSRGGDSRAQQGYHLFLSEDGGTIHSKSQKDKNVSISSYHSELNALVEAAKAIIFTRGLLEELGQPQNNPSLIYQDNVNVIHT